MYDLVHLATREQVADEGARMHSAVLYFFEHFEKKGIQVYSLRLGGASVLTLSVLPEKTCAHVVGLRNREPTADELSALAPLLEALGVTLLYDKSTNC